MPDDPTKLSLRTPIIELYKFGVGKLSALMAKKLAVAGATVVLVARSRDRLDETARVIAEMGGEASVVPCDLTDMDAITLSTAGLVDQFLHPAVDGS